MKTDKLKKIDVSKLKISRLSIRDDMLVFRAKTENGDVYRLGIRITNEADPKTAIEHFRDFTRSVELFLNEGLAWGK